MNFDNDYSAPDSTREKLQQVLTGARERTNDALARGEQCVRDRPGAALLAAFGVGLLVGAAATMAMRPEPRRATFAESLGDSRERLAELLGTVASNLRDPLRKTYSSVSDRATDLGGAVAGALEKMSCGKKPRWL